MIPYDPKRIATRFDSSAEAYIRPLFRTCPPEEFLFGLARYVPRTRDEEAVYERFHGWALLDMGDNRAARDHLARALHRSRPSSENRALARGLLAEVCMRLGNLRAADRCTHRALADLPEVDEGSFLRAGHLMQLGRAHRRRGHLTQAVATHRRGLSLIGPESPWWHPLTANLVFALTQLGRLLEADAVVRRHRELATESAAGGREWATLLAEAQVAARLADLNRATRIARECGALMESAGPRASFMQVELRCELARVSGGWEDVERELIGALESCEPDGRHSDFVATFSRLLAESYVDRGRDLDALQPARLAVRLGRREDRLEWCLGLRALGRSLAGLGRRDEALRAFREALGIHERCEFHLAHRELRLTLEQLGFADGREGAVHVRSTRGPSLADEKPVRIQLMDKREFISHDRDLLERIELAAASHLPALIEGETGTGKEIVARLLHELSPRRAGAFVVVDCSSIPAELADAELFGVARGAYTGAHRDRAGLVAEADGGTLFLDELPELGLALQAKLLRTLQDGSYRRVGESLVRRISIRVVAATNRNVEDLIGAGRLKADLFHRLNGHRIRLEPLRRRRGEIEPIVEEIARSCGLAGVTPAALRALQRHDWPGNVRELEMAVRVGACRCPAGERLDADHLPQLGVGLASSLGTSDSLRSGRVAWERATLIGAMRDCGGVISRAARSLGLTRQAFYKAMRRTGLTAREVRAEWRGREVPSLSPPR
jgi:two-component system response regulator HydG